MALHYSVVAQRNPQKPDEAYRFYARSQTKETIRLNKLSEELSDGRTLTSVEIYGVIRSLIKAIKLNLAKGYCIDLEDLGKFRYTISSDSAISKEAFSEHYIKNVKLKFTPVRYIKPKVEDMEFVNVLPRNVQQEAARNYKQT
ncbi:MAG: hypothetical protein LUG18_14925 [Candidatus Azobacteroides sp.]|nr:hypothetical protein [Candidatus Azobacteroides sp.]